MKSFVAVSAYAALMGALMAASIALAGDVIFVPVAQLPKNCLEPLEQLRKKRDETLDRCLSAEQTIASSATEGILKSGFCAVTVKDPRTKAICVAGEIGINLITQVPARLTLRECRKLETALQKFEKDLEAQDVALVFAKDGDVAIDWNARTVVFVINKSNGTCSRPTK